MANASIALAAIVSVGFLPTKKRSALVSRLVADFFRDESMGRNLEQQAIEVQHPGLIQYS